MGFSWILSWNIVEKGTIVLMRSLCKYSLLELPKKKKKVWLMDALGIIKKKKLLSFIFIVFSKNAKIIGESLHDHLWYHEMKQTIKPIFIFNLISWDTL